MNTNTAAKTHTLVVLVLDESGSMESDADAVISGFNEQIQTLQRHAADAGETAVSLITFSDPASVTVAYSHRAPSAAPELSRHTYQPRGSTALFDAINRALDLAQTHPHYKDEGTGVLVLAFTDGQENASREVTGKQLASRIRELEASGRWTVTLLGPDGVQHAAKDLSLREDNVMAAAMHTRVGKEQAFIAMSMSTAAYMSRRGAGERASPSFYAEEKQRRGQPAQPPKDGSGS